MRTISEVNTAIISQLELELNKVLPLFPKAANRVISKMLAGAFILLGKYLGVSFFQMFVVTATWEQIEIDGKFVKPLELWADIFDVGAPIGDTHAELEIEIPTTAAGDTIKAAYQFRHRPSDLIYLCTADTVTTTPTTTVPVQCTTGGEIGNLDAGVGVVLEVVEPRSSIADSGTVSALTVNGADGDTESVYRQRILDRAKLPAEGGAPYHYWTWATSVDGIPYAYPYVSTIIPTAVEIYVDTEDGSAPTAAQLTAVENAVEAERPVSDKVDVAGVTFVSFDVEVRDLDSKNLNDAKTRITTVIKNYFRSREPFIDGVSKLPARDILSSGEVQGLVMEEAARINATLSGVSITLATVPVVLWYLGRDNQNRGKKVTAAVTYP